MSALTELQDDVRRVAEALARVEALLAGGGVAAGAGGPPAGPLPPYTVRQAAAAAGVSRVRMLRAVHAGELAAYDVRGRERPSYRVPRAAVAEWLEARRVNPTGGRPGAGGVPRDAVSRHHKH